MDCSVIQADLIAYHFGTTEEDARERIDAHLLECTSCLRAYLALKRHFEQAPASARPRPEAKKRLRDEVEAAFRPRAGARVARWLRRPIPLYQGLAVAAVALVVAVTAPLVAKVAPLERNTTQPTAGGQRIDTARPMPESLSFY